MKGKAASIIVFNDKGEVLLQKRDNKPNVREAGKWDFWGGACEDGEEFKQCAIREFKEETGIAVDNELDLKYIATIFYSTEVGDREEALFAYHYGLPQKPPVYEGESSEWFPSNEILNLNFALGAGKLATAENINKAKELFSL